MTTLEWTLLVISLVLFLLVVGLLVTISRWRATWAMTTYVLTHAAYKSEEDKLHVAETLAWAGEWQRDANPFQG